jgi:NAD(P)H dehydrogenase (quinone)
MNCLIVYSHPNPKSFNHAIKEILKKAFEAQGHDVRVRDLYAIKFNPVLSAKDFVLMAKHKVAGDVKKEQGHVRWADVLVFVFPVWWDSLPAITRGYLDRVFSTGFAYTHDGKGLLKDKKVAVICTFGAPKHVCERSGVFKAMDVTVGECLAGFCGMTLIESKYFTSVPSVSDAERKNMLEEVALLAKKAA